MTLPVPTEEVEQRNLVEYLRLRRIPHFRVPNETYTKSWAQKRKNKELGVQAGIPDLFVLVGGKWHGFEMKRTIGGTVSPHQKYWINLLNETGIPTHVFRGAEEAINFINK